MKPFKFWLFGGGVLYNVLVIGIAQYSAAAGCLMHCISCCAEIRF
jgi:hypothetical protein